MAKQLMPSNQDEIEFTGPDGKTLGLREAWEYYCNGKAIYPASMTEEAVAAYVKHFTYWAGIKGTVIDIKMLLAPLPPKIEHMSVTDIKTERDAAKAHQQAQRDADRLAAKKAREDALLKAKAERDAAKAKGKPAEGPPEDVRLKVEAANPLVGTIGIDTPVQPVTPAPEGEQSNASNV